MALRARQIGSWLLPLTLALGPTFGCDSGSSSSASPPPTDDASPAAEGSEPASDAAPEPEQAVEEQGDGAEAPEPAPEPEPAPIEDKTILILGSSLAATGFGALLEDKLHAHSKITCHRKAKSATGLARPDFFDWTSTAEKQLEEHNPDLVVVIMGANDGQDLIPRKGKGRVRWKTDEWEPAYRERVDAFVSLLAGTDRQVLWLGIPRTNTTNLEAKLKIIRSVHKAAAEGHERGAYVDLSKFVENEAGNLIKEARVKGKNRKIRGDDGVHFTMSGSEYLAASVYPDVLGVLGMPEDEAPAEE